MHLLRNVAYATTCDALERLLDKQSPARHVLRDDVSEALEKHSFAMGALYFPCTSPAARDHFLPHTGLWLDRPMSDVMMHTQLWTHTAFHNWYGMPLPVGDVRHFTDVNFVAEIHAVIGSEYDFFVRFPAAKAIFNPNFVSTYDAFCAVGHNTASLAAGLMMRMQFRNEPGAPADVRNHPKFKGGVAITLLRQAAWSEHDRVWCNTMFGAQQSEKFKDVYTNLWRCDDHATIQERIAAGPDGLLAWSKRNSYDGTRATHAVAVNMTRVLGLSLAEHCPPADWASAINNLIMLRDCSDPDKVIQYADDYAAKYGVLQTPMPLWNAAKTFRRFRLQWEQSLAERTAAWRAEVQA